MKFLLKVTRLAAVIALSLNATHSVSSDIRKKEGTVMPSGDSEFLGNRKFKSNDDQVAYVLGTALGRYMNNTLQEQEKLGIILDKGELITGIQDSFAHKTQISDAHISKILHDLEIRIQTIVKRKIAKEEKENEVNGIKYRDSFAKERSVKKTRSGLLYQVEKLGKGVTPKDTDTLLVNYRGTLIDGTEFDSSYTRHKPLSIRLDSVIPGWREGLKQIKKGGKIKLVIPPVLGYNKDRMPGIPPNSTLIFNIELLDVKPYKN